MCVTILSGTQRLNTNTKYHGEIADSSDSSGSHRDYCAEMFRRNCERTGEQSADSEEGNTKSDMNIR